MGWWIWAAAPALGATWTYRAPVPVTAPADGKGFRLCLDLPAKLEMEATTVTDGGVSLTCESTEESTKMCYEVREPWPESYKPLVCEGKTTSVRLQLVPAFDPNDSVRDGEVLISSAVDEVAAAFALPPGVWPAQVHEGTRDTVCRIEDQRLWVWREGTSRRRGMCEIRDRYGNLVRFTVRSGRFK